MSRVLPGMQAAFVEIGLERTAFLHAADIAQRVSDDTLIGAALAGLAAIEDIRRLVNEGDDILVQVIKDPIGTKGARLTTFVALPSRYLVYMPRGDGVGVSTRIEDEAERLRLKGVLSELAADGNGGYIVRTAAQGASAETCARTCSYLRGCGNTCRHAPRPPPSGSWCTRTCRCRCACCAMSWRAASSRVLVDSAREHARMQRVRRGLHARRSAGASSCTAARARSSTCTASRRRSPRRSTARCR